jgi:hypothetical protein
MLVIIFMHFISYIDGLCWMLTTVNSRNHLAAFAHEGWGAARWGEGHGAVGDEWAVGKGFRWMSDHAMVGG